MEAKDLIEILNENKIENYQLNNNQRGLRLFNIEDFDKFISNYNLNAYQENHGQQAPYGWNQEVFTDYNGWRITSNTKHYR